jgi:aminopeptidase C
MRRRPTNHSIEPTRYVSGKRERRLPVTYLNLPIEEFKELALSQLKEGEAVWFGCDVGQWHEKKSGVMDTDAEGDELFSTTFR